MTDFPEALETLDTEQGKLRQIHDIIAMAHQAGYQEVEVDTKRPWGGFVRFNNDNAEQFIADFFPGLTLQEAKQGVDEAPLSPKLLLVLPAQRLSLQTHERRGERWRFITSGDYYHGSDGETGQLRHAKAGDVVQFAPGDIHRLCGADDSVVLVAEIWQHTDPSNLSNEKDITRLEDDYSR